MSCCTLASFAVASRRVPLALSIFGRFARHRDGVVCRSRASRVRVLACASCAIARLSRCALSRRRRFAAFVPFAVASWHAPLAPSILGRFVVIATAWWIARAPLALVCRLAPLAPSRVSRVARRRDGDSLLHSRVVRSCISARASGAVGLRSLRSSSRRRGGSRARLSRSRVGLHLSRHRASLTWRVVTTAMIRCILAPFTAVSRRVPLAPSIFGRFADRRDGVSDRSRASRARMLACASRAATRPSGCSSSRRQDSLHSRAIRGGFSACAFGAVDLLGCFARHCDGVVDCSRVSRAHVSARASCAVARLSRRSSSRRRLFVAFSGHSQLPLGVCLWGRRSSVSSLVIATAWRIVRAPLALTCRLAPHAPSRVSRVARRHDDDFDCIPAPFAVASRRVPLAPSIFGRFARHRDGVPYHSRVSRARVSARASRAVARLSRRSSSRRRWFVAFSRHSRLPLGVCLWGRRSSVSSLVIATAWRIVRAPLALTCRLAPHAPSRVSRVARRHDDDFVAFPHHSRLHLGVCLWRRRSSVTSLVIETASHTTRASLALACRLAPPAPSRVSRVARRRDGGGSLRSRAIRGCPSACAYGAVGLRSLRSSSRRRGELFARLSRSHVGSRLTRRLASRALLVVTTVIFVAFPHHSRLHLGVCLWRRRSSVASLVIETASHTTRASLALACRLAPPAPSRVSRVARRRDGAGSLRSRAIRGCPSACAYGAVGLRSLRSSSRRRGELFARLSRSHVGSRLTRRLASRALLVVTTMIFVAFPHHSRLHLGVCLWRRRSSVTSLVIETASHTTRASLALACRLAPPAPSRVSRVARRRDGGGSLRSRAIRGCPSACAYGAVGLRSLRSSSRRRGELLARLSRSHVGSRLTRRLASLALLVVTTVIFVAFSRHSRLHLGVCLWRRRSSVASLVIATAWWIARASLALACRLAPPAPSRVSRVARRHDGDDSLRSRAIRGCPSACAYGAVGLRSLRSSSRRRGGLFARLSRSHVGSRLTRRLASLALLVVTTVIFVAFSRHRGCISACASGAVDLFGCFARHRDGVGGSLARLSRSRVGSRLPRRRASLASLVVTTAMIRCILAPFAVAPRRVPLAPSVFGCFARHRDGVADRSRASRARVSARASRAVARLSRRSSSRRR